MVPNKLYSMPLIFLCLTGSAFALNDPTRPTDPAAYFGTHNTSEGGDWSLQSILFAPDRKVAVINGIRVKEGDRVGAARVFRIHDSYVLLRTGRRTLTLRLLPESIKVKP